MKSTRYYLFVFGSHKEVNGGRITTGCRSLVRWRTEPDQCSYLIVLRKLIEDEARPAFVLGFHKKLMKYKARSLVTVGGPV